jgi:hypothetical protein
LLLTAYLGAHISILAAGITTAKPAVYMQRKITHLTGSVRDMADIQSAIADVQENETITSYEMYAH